MGLYGYSRRRLLQAPYPIMLDNFSTVLNADDLKILHGISKFGIAWPSIDVHRQIISYS
jgi:hypothetical protein